MRRLVGSLVVVAACGGSEATSGDTGFPGNNGPDVDIAVSDVTFDRSGAHVAFTVVDGQGTALDITGDKVDVSFVLAQLAANPDGSPGQYTAYTTRNVTRQFPTPDANVSAIQATNESVDAGKLDIVDRASGSYRYTFAADVSAHDPTLRQSVLALAVREVGDTESIDRALFSSGTDGREEVTDATCGSCHGTFAAHGGRYTSTTQCVLCHTAQTTDPDSGNTVDFRVMIHKIHAGENLASHAVNASSHYTIIGFMGSVHDFATVAFPGPAENGTNVARCETCHAGAQGDVWRTRPSQTTCTSCHDTTIFSKPDNPPFTVAHQGGVDPNLVNDTTCVICHGATSGVAPITAAHYQGVFDAAFTKVELAVQSVANAGPAMLPTLTFQVTVNGAPRDIVAAPLTSLTATLAGPTTDIAQYWQARIQGTGAVGTLAAVDAANGVFAYTFPAAGCTDASSPSRACAIPPAATGSYEAGLEGYFQPNPAVPRAAAFSPVLAFAVTDAAPLPRRVIVSADTCNRCHLDLAAHGGSRKNPNYCVFCHNPNKANDTRVPRLETGAVLAQSVDLRVMIHKIHMGEELTQGYILGGFPAPTPDNPRGTPTNFGETRYPRARTDCEACHVSKNWTLPMTNSPAYLPSTELVLTCRQNPSADPNGFCEAPDFLVAQRIELQPQTSVCTSCHDMPATLAHAQVNTTPQGAEACATCHGVGMAWDVTKFHGSP